MVNTEIPEYVRATALVVKEGGRVRVSGLGMLTEWLLVQSGGSHSRAMELCRELDLSDAQAEVLCRLAGNRWGQ